MCFMWFLFLFKRTGCQSLLSAGHSFLGHLLPVLCSCEGSPCKRRWQISPGSLLLAGAIAGECPWSSAPTQAPGPGSLLMVIDVRWPEIALKRSWKERERNESYFWQIWLLDRLNLWTTSPPTTTTQKKKTKQNKKGLVKNRCIL